MGAGAADHAATAIHKAVAVVAAVAVVGGGGIVATKSRTDSDLLLKSGQTSAPARADVGPAVPSRLLPLTPAAAAAPAIAGAPALAGSPSDPAAATGPLAGPAPDSIVPGAFETPPGTIDPVVTPIEQGGPEQGTDSPSSGAPDSTSGSDTSLPAADTGSGSGDSGGSGGDPSSGGDGDTSGGGTDTGGSGPTDPVVPPAETEPPPACDLPPGLEKKNKIPPGHAKKCAAAAEVTIRLPPSRSSQHAASSGPLAGGAPSAVLGCNRRPGG